MIDMSEVGATPTEDAAGNWTVHFGIYLPGITFNKGYSVAVRVIHELDQFVHNIEPTDVFLDWDNGTPLDLWEKDVPLTPVAGTHFGQPGNYLYRFQLQRGGENVTFWFADPFAFASGMGTLSSFTIDSAAQPFPWTDASFTAPEVDRMVVYELNVREFNTDFQGVIDQLDYIQGLGVNVIELMPVSNVKEQVEWGYTPLAYFAPDQRLGGVLGLKLLVDASHARGIAIIVDSVYAHAHPEFAYNLVYDTSGEANPMMGVFAGEFFPGRPGTDYSKQFTRDYFLAVNRYWLREFHVDGFRYDYVPGFFDGPAGRGYAQLVYQTYQDSKAIARFNAGNGRSKIIQCAENLPDPAGILANTYTNCGWNNALLSRAQDMARWNYVSADIAHLLDPQFEGFPTQYTNPASNESFPVASFQYLETHDHSRFINQFGHSQESDLIGDAYGDRSRFYKMQPYVIALYTAKGIPMLWNGQEFGENWGLPDNGIGRNLFERPLHWEYFYDREGKALVRLFRIMGTLRRNHPALGSRGFFYYYFDSTHLSQGVIAFRRDAPASAGQAAESMVVFLNFFDRAALVSVPFPFAGTWREQIDGTSPPVVTNANEQSASVNVPSNYGAVYLLQ